MRESSRIASIAGRAIAASAVVLATLGLAAPSASAAGATGFGNGPVGVPQVVTATGICPSSQLTLLATYSNGVTASSNPVLADINGSATIYWTPTIAGTITQAQIGSSCAPVSIGGATIFQVSTTTVVSAPNNAQVGKATQINVTVQSQSPSNYAPTGQVVVKDINGATLATMGLTPGPGNGQAYAYYWWTPQTAGSYTFQATYNGDANATGSNSPQDVVIATPSGNPITLTNPATMTQGVPVTLTATVYPLNTQGSVGFTLNGAPISASVPLVNGVANFLWTPNTVGSVTIGANYMTNQGGSGSTSNQVNIVAGPVATDVVTLTQPGFGTWAPNGTYTLPLGSSTTFTASSLSGSPVTLTESGPCSVSGLTVNVPTSGTQCNLVATTNGGNGYAPARTGYTITTSIGQQTSTVNPPVSGRVTLKRAYILEGPGQGDTNAGQNINWSINKSAKKAGVCKLYYPNDGSVTVKVLKKGRTCTITGRAPGVPNVWAPYVISRSYYA